MPMATDIAFAVGMMALLGARVSAGAKLLLLSLAIVDDVIAVLVIAVYYSEQVSVGWLVAGLVGCWPWPGWSGCAFLGRCCIR